MKQLCCGDVLSGCKTVFRESTEERILAAIARHACRDHGLERIPVALIAQIRRNISDAPATP